MVPAGRRSAQAGPGLGVLLKRSKQSRRRPKSVASRLRLPGRGPTRRHPPHPSRPTADPGSGRAVRDGVKAAARSCRSLTRKEGICSHGTEPWAPARGSEANGRRRRQSPPACAPLRRILATVPGPGQCVRRDRIEPWATRGPARCAALPACLQVFLPACPSRLILAFAPFLLTVPPAYPSRLPA